MSRKSRTSQTAPGTAQNHRSRNLLIPGCALILFATFLVYRPALRGGMLWDDDVLIKDNDLIKSLPGLGQIWFTTQPVDYFPLTYSSLWIEWHLWGMDTTGYHATNILLHALNAILVWLVLKRLRIPGAWFAGMIFAVHPVCVPSVAWMTERKNVLSLFFALLAVLTFLQFEKDRRWRWYAAALAAFLFSLLAKTSGVMLPLVLLGCILWLTRRISVKDLLRVSPFFLISFALGLATMWFQHHRAFGPEPLPLEPVTTAIARAGMAVWFYIGKIALPIHQSMVYPKWEIDGHGLLSFLPSIAVLALLALAFAFRRTWGQPVLFALGAFVVLLFPVLGFAKMYFMRYSFVADHWQYLPMIAMIALGVGVVAHAAERRGPCASRAAAIAGGVLILSLGALSWRQAHCYARAEELWRDTIRENPGADAARGNLGVILTREEMTLAAIPMLEAGLRSDPHAYWLHTNLALNLSKVDRVDEALEHFRLTMQYHPETAGAVHCSMGAILADHKRFGEAIAEDELALKTESKNPDLLFNLGSALLRTDRPADAAMRLRQSLAFDPGNVRAHNDLGVALMQQGKPEEALPEFEAALRLDPTFALAAQNRDYITRLTRRQAPK